jgi:hypothetical protein
MLMTDFIKDLLNYVSDASAQIKTLLTGALGAVIATSINGYLAKRKVLKDEIRALDIANVLTFNIVDKALNLKVQHLIRIKNDYDRLTDLNDNARMKGNTSLEEPLDIRTLQIVNFPIQQLEKIIFEKLYINAEGISALVTLSSVISALLLSINNRNDLCSEFRENWNEPYGNRLSKYLGLVNGTIEDNRFRDNIEALCAQANDCIFFAMHLNAIIIRAENEIRQKRKFYLLPGQKLISPNWDTAKSSGFMPDPDDYKDWMNGFIRRPSRFGDFTQWLREHRWL